MVFLNPWADPLGDGFQMIQSLIAVGTGGVFGRGPDGRRAEAVLPAGAAHRLHLRGHRRGARLIGATVVLACFCVIAWRGLRTAMRAPDRFGAFLALGLTAMVAFQAFFNISVVLGLLPTKGIPLPFVSYGGSSLLINLIGMGILLNVSQHALDVARRDDDARCRGPRMHDAAARRDRRRRHRRPPVSGHRGRARAAARAGPMRVITFAGTARGIEARVVPREGFELDLLRSAGLEGHVDRGARARGSLLLPLSGARRVAHPLAPAADARDWRRRLQLGAGRARRRRCAASRRCCSSRTRCPGLTNRLLARCVSAAAVTFESTVSFFGRRGFVAGNPVRPEFFAPNIDRPAPRTAGRRGF